MAKYGPGDRLVLASVYMDGWFKHSPDPLTVQAVDEAKGLYTVLTTNTNGYKLYTIQYLDSAYRYASPDEIKNLFK